MTDFSTNRPPVHYTASANRRQPTVYVPSTKIPDRAARTARFIGVLKWVVVGAQLLWGVLVIVGIAQAETWPEWTLMLEPVAGLAAALVAVVTWVLFGWFQHMLATNAELVRLASR
jgi:hypothetical protein